MNTINGCVHFVHLGKRLNMTLLIQPTRYLQPATSLIDEGAAALNQLKYEARYATFFAPKSNRFAERARA